MHGSRVITQAHSIAVLLRSTLVPFRASGPGIARVQEKNRNKTCARTQDNAPSAWLPTAPDTGRIRSQDSASRVRRAATRRSKQTETKKQPHTLFEPRPFRAVPAHRSARAQELAHARKTTRFPCGFAPLRMPVGFVCKEACRTSFSDTALEATRDAKTTAHTLRTTPVPFRARTPIGTARKYLRTHARQRAFRVASYRSGCRSVSFARQRVARRAATRRSELPETPRRPLYRQMAHPCRSVPARRPARHGHIRVVRSRRRWVHKATDGGK